MKEKSAKIISFDIENVKRVQAVSLSPAENGLTIIGGDNRQGKSSCLDAIMAALGGEKFTPSEALRDGTKKGQVTVELSNGMTVTKSFTQAGSYLKVDSLEGRGGQGLLNQFISNFALDLSSFLTASDKARAEILLKIIGVDLTPLDEKYKKLYADREAVGRMETKAKGHAESMPYDEEAGNQLMTPTEIMTELEDKLQVNAKNREIREKAESFAAHIRMQERKLSDCKDKIKEIKLRLKSAEDEYSEQDLTWRRMKEEYTDATSKVTELKDEDTTALKEKLTEIDEINARVRKNLEREKALAEVEGYHVEYLSLNQQIESIREEKKALLNGAKMPLEGLSVEEGVLTYNGHAWDCMSHAEQLIAATAICRAINSRMGFVLIDKLEAMDLKTLREFGGWLKAENLQAITTRVSQGEECSVIIEDGLIAKQQEEELKFD